jgi:hydroxymethylglutaryl-CoA lyase
MQSARQRRLYIQEVSVRDGFQIEPRFMRTEQKIDLVNRLARSGLAKIEVTPVTSPKAIPAPADAEAVMRGIDRVEGVVYAAPVPNVRGCERALEAAVDEINLVMSASASHNMANLRMTREQSWRNFPRSSAWLRRVPTSTPRSPRHSAARSTVISPTSLLSGR